MSEQNAVIDYGWSSRAVCGPAVPTPLAGAGAAQADDGSKRAATVCDQSDYAVTSGMPGASRGGETVILPDATFGENANRRDALVAMGGAL